MRPAYWDKQFNEPIPLPKAKPRSEADTNADFTTRVLLFLVTELATAQAAVERCRSARSPHSTA
jgi:hypothetical protein